MRQPVYPPLFKGRAVAGSPRTEAVSRAQDGCDAGLVLHAFDADRMRAAVVFAPDVCLADAVAVLPVCGIGFQNALGALAPPEIAVHVRWDGTILVNGGRCGRLTLSGPDCAPGDVPDWLVVGLELQLWPQEEEAGLTPDVTALFSEGCAEVDPVDLLEAWIRHSLVWLDTWESEGTRPVHRDFAGIMDPQGSAAGVDGVSGEFVGLDESLGLLLKVGDTTRLLPLTDLLEIHR